MSEEKSESYGFISGTGFPVVDKRIQRAFSGESERKAGGADLRLIPRPCRMPRLGTSAIAGNQPKLPQLAKHPEGEALSRRSHLTSLSPVAVAAISIWRSRVASG
jgi:hypothetical protein